VRFFTKSGRVELYPKDIEALLEANSDGGKWEPAHHSQKPGQKETKVVPVTLWKRQDGATAHRTGVNGLQIQVAKSVTDDLLKAARAEKEQKAKRQPDSD